MYSPPDTKKCECGYIFPAEEESASTDDVSSSSFRKPSSTGFSPKIFNIFGFGRRPILKTILVISIVLFVIAYFLKDKLPDFDDVSPLLYNEPVQIKNDVLENFEITKEGITYFIRPVYTYELYGLVVSYHDSDDFLDYYHEKWKDYLNIKDLCVIWGKNIKSRVFTEMEFYSRDFTCHYKYPNIMAKKLFTEDCLSNNHILTDKEELVDKIMSVKRGDQVYFKGYLVHYGHKDNKHGKFRRATSVERTDRGNHACENVYVTDFKILKKADRTLHKLYSFLKYFILVMIVFLLVDMHFSQPGPGHE